MSLKQLGTDNIFEPGPNKIFVFGSNLAGRHGAGAARTAYKNYGAILGIAEGLIGNSYAIPTKDEELETLTLPQIKFYVERFISIARSRGDLEFFVTRIGCGLAGYSDKDIAPMFKNAPNNCVLPPGWREFNQNNENT